MSCLGAEGVNLQSQRSGISGNFKYDWNGFDVEVDGAGLLVSF